MIYIIYCLKINDKTRDMVTSFYCVFSQAAVRYMLHSCVIKIKSSHYVFTSFCSSFSLGVQFYPPKIMQEMFTSPNPVPIVNVNYSSNQITSPAAVDPDCLHSFLCLCLFQIRHKDFSSEPLANSITYQKE